MGVLSTAREDIESITSYLGKYGIQTVGTFTGKLRSQVQLIAFGTVDYGLSRLLSYLPGQQLCDALFLRGR